MRKKRCKRARTPPSQSIDHSRYLRGCLFGFVCLLQVAAFVAVVLSVTVTSLGWLDHVIPTVDDVYYDDRAAPASR